MKKTFLGFDRPILTVMVQARTPQRILELIENGKKAGADAFGVQIEMLKPEYRKAEIYKELFDAMEDKPAYVTNYRSQQNAGKSDEQCSQELMLAMENGGTLYDMPGDLFRPSVDELTYDEATILKQKMLISDLHKMGKEVLISSHTNRFLPLDAVLKIAQAQKERGADISKIVTCANTENELSENFKISATLKQQLGIPHLFLCGGEKCRKHRLLNPVVGSYLYLCVTEHDECATPVQPLITDAIKVLKAAEYIDSEEI